jgi:hypothetical protein
VHDPATRHRDVDVVDARRGAPDRGFGNLDAERAVERDRGFHVPRHEVDQEEIGGFIASLLDGRRGSALHSRAAVDEQEPAGSRISRWCHTPRGTIAAWPAFSAIVRCASPVSSTTSSAPETSSSTSSASGCISCVDEWRSRDEAKSNAPITRPSRCCAALQNDGVTSSGVALPPSSDG